MAGMMRLLEQIPAHAKETAVMIDARIGKRIKQCRERLGLTQEEFAEKAGFSANYISTLERGKSFPRCENLIALLNHLKVPADAIFCDVVTYANPYRAVVLSEKLNELPPETQKRILRVIELLIQDTILEIPAKNTTP